MPLTFFEDILFSAIAAIGFASISNPPRKAYAYCAAIAAIGHSLRFLMLNCPGLHIHIVVATTIAAFAIGLAAVIISRHSKIPPETYLYPALLPMIPGMCAYRCFGGLAMCIYHSGEQTFNHYFYLFAQNGFTCFFTLFGMALGATIPIFMFEHISFQATRDNSSHK